MAAALLCVALLGGLAAEAGAQSDACAGTESAGRLTPDNEQWPNRDRIAALKASHPELWRKVCADLPMPNPNGGGGPVLVSNLGQTSDTGWAIGAFERAQRFRTGSNAKGYVLDSVDVSFLELNDPRAFSRLSVTVRDSSGARAVGTLVPPPFEATNSERAYRFEAFGVSNGLPGINLAPSTTYMLLLDVTRNWSGNNTLTDTRSDGEDRGGASGWSIDNNLLSRSFASTGSFSSSAESLKIGLNGRPRPAGAAPWVRITAMGTVEGGDIVVSAQIAGAHSEALSFYVDMRECDWHPPTTQAYFDPAAHDATAACAAAAPGAGYAREADFNMWHPDGSARAFIHIAAGATSGELRLPAIAGDGAEGSEAIAFMVAPYREAARAYVGYASGRHWHHPDSPPDGYSGQRHPLWVASIEASQSSPMTPGGLVPDGARVGGRGLSVPAVDAALVTAVRDLAGQVHHGQAHVDRWRRVLVAFGLETYDGLTAITETEARDNAARYHSPLWPQIADVLAKLQTPDPPDTPDTPQDGGTADPPQQDTPQDGGTQDGGTADPPQQDTPPDPPQQGYTVDAAVVAKVKALAAQTHHGTVHVNRWNRVLVAFGEHDGTGVTGGPMTLDEAEDNARRYSSPAWNEVVTELTNLQNAQ